MNQERSPLLVTKADCLRNERNWKGKSWGLAWGLCALPPSSLPARTLCLCVALSCLRFRMVGEWVATQLILELLQAGCCEGWESMELRRVNFRCVSCAVSDCIALHELS
jgi:hypothetical protein